MALPGKQRFKALDIEKVRVELNATKEPISVRYKHKSWPGDKELRVMGFATNEDIVPTDMSVSEVAELFSSGQYILADKDMNMYEAHIYVIDTPNGWVGYMNVIRTNPSS